MVFCIIGAALSRMGMTRIRRQRSRGNLCRKASGRRHEQPPSAFMAYVLACFRLRGYSHTGSKSGSLALLSFSTGIIWLLMVVERVSVANGFSPQGNACHQTEIVSWQLLYAVSFVKQKRTDCFSFSTVFFCCREKNKNGHIDNRLQDRYKDGLKRLQYRCRKIRPGRDMNLISLQRMAI
jgi:hypothetical protein